jgi:multiple sugar transport system ATP-binding protein
MAGVSLKNIWKVYDNGYQAVKGLNLEIADGELIVLVGPSGCGKSTTLRMVAGLEDVSSGDIFIGTRNVTDVLPKDRDIAMVFQSYALYPHMTCYDNMAFGLRLKGMKEADIDARIRATAEKVEITRLLDKKPKTLSGGQRQRIALGRAMVREPAVFLFDEPLSNLDARLRLETRGQIKRLQQELKTTAIYVTHDQEEAMTLGDRIVVMNDGIIQQADTPLNVYRKPANRFVAGFIGSPPMNLLEGSVEITRPNHARFTGPENLTLDVSFENPSVSQGSRIPATLGFRPEAIVLSPTPVPGQSIPCTVDVLEPLGDRTLVQLIGPGKSHLTASVPPDTSCAPGDAWHLTLQDGATHLFRSDTPSHPRI